MSTNTQESISRDNLTGFEENDRITSQKTHYTIKEKLGDGAIGVVFRAVNESSKSQVAVKVLAPESKIIDRSSFEEIKRRFKREGERGIGLNHEHLVKIHSYEENTNGASFFSETGSQPQNPFLIMEYIEGVTLEKVIKKRTPREIKTTQDNISIAHQLSQALTYLHKQRVVHRDVKPANIFITRDFHNNPVAKLGDFGIVKWGDFRASITTGTLTTIGQEKLGTQKYMPPEQSLDPSSVSVKSDMHSLGITLWELFTSQILPDVHHVYLLKEVKSMRGKSIESKMNKLGFNILSSPELHNHRYIFELILDCLASVAQRPSSSQMQDRLRGLIE